MYRFIILILFMIMSVVPLFSQVRIDAQLIDQNVHTYFLNDFNFTGHSIPAHDIFSLSIQNISSQPVNCFLSLDIRSETFGHLAFGETNQFPLAGQEIIRITNRNLFTASQRFSLTDYNIEKAADDLKRKILAMGKLPSGTYAFEFRLRARANGYEYEDRALLTFTISNPSTLDLIAPGNNSSEQYSEILHTTHPLFRWESNMEKFRLIIAEKIPVLHDQASPEEIIQGKIIYDRILKIDPTLTGSEENIVYIPSTFYQYPFAEASPLQPGKTYYWRLYGLASTSSQDIEYPSEIWSFTLADPAQELTDANLKTLYNLLLSLPLDELLTLMGPGGALEGYSPTGLLMINGRTVSIDQVIQLLTKLQSGEYTIENVVCQ